MLVKAKMTKTLGQEELEKKTLVEWDGRGMKFSSVIDMELKFGIHIITHKIYSLSRLKSVLCEAVVLAYKVVKNNLSFDLAKLLLRQFNKNMESIRTSKNNPCKFGSLLTYLFFYVQIFFSSKGTIVWRKDVHVLYQINEYIAKMGENYNSIMENYFDGFKEKMNNRYQILKKLVEYYKDDVCFMVDSDKVYIQVVRPRIAWVKPLGYEVIIDATKDIIGELVNELVDPKVAYFGTFYEAKAKIELEIKLPQAINKGKKKIAKLKPSSTLLLTKGKGEDKEVEDEEESMEEEPLRKKGR